MKKFLTISLAVFLALALAVFPALAATVTVNLGSAASFAVLAGTTVTNTGPSRISGDVGVHPGTAVTGFPPGLVTNGTIHSANALAMQAKDSLTTAYNDAAGRTPFTNVAVELGGRTLVDGVYRGGTLGITGTLTLDGQRPEFSIHFPGRDNPDNRVVQQGCTHKGRSGLQRLLAGRKFSDPGDGLEIRGNNPGFDFHHGHYSGEY